MEVHQILRDNIDFQKLISWLAMHETFCQTIAISDPWVHDLHEQKKKTTKPMVLNFGLSRWKKVTK